MRNEAQREHAIASVKKYVASDFNTDAIVSNISSYIDKLKDEQGIDAKTFTDKYIIFKMADNLQINSDSSTDASRIANNIFITDLAIDTCLKARSLISQINGEVSDQIKAFASRFDEFIGLALYANATGLESQLYDLIALEELDSDEEDSTLLNRLNNMKQAVNEIKSYSNELLTTGSDWFSQVSSVIDFTKILGFTSEYKSNLGEVYGSDFTFNEGTDKTPAALYTLVKCFIQYLTNLHKQEEKEEADAEKAAEQARKDAEKAAEQAVKEAEHETKEDDEDEIKKYIEQNPYFENTIVNKAVDTIASTYSLLFESGFGLEPPVGLLIKNSQGHFRLLTVENEHGVLKAPEYTYSILGEELLDKYGFKASESRDFSVSSAVNYFPYRLAEYAFGRARCTDAEKAADPMLYKRHTSLGQWTGSKGYLETRIKPDIKNFIHSVILDLTKQQLKESNITIEELFSPDNMNGPIVNLQNTAKEFINGLIDSMCRCILIVENSKAQLQIRFSCGNTPITEKNMEDIKAKIERYISVEQLDDGTYDMSCRDMQNKGRVYELSFVKNSKLLGAVPLFAYKAAEVLNRQGKSISWNSIILGKDEDRNILTANSDGSPVKFPNGTDHCTHISAGSGSGKGVMTLNILGSALANDIPVIYLDSKPDMSLMIYKLMQGSNLKAFIYNGGSISTIALDQADAELAYQVFGETGRPNWSQNIPVSLKDIGDYSAWSALGYLKALDFSLFIMAKIGDGEQTLQKFCGVSPDDRKVVVIADELQALQAALSPILTTIMQKAKVIEDKVKANGKKTADKQVALTDDEKAVLALGAWAGPGGWYNSLDTARTRDFRESNKSTMFTIYQTFDPEDDRNNSTAGLPYEYSPAGKHVFANSAIFRALTDNVGSQALLGFDGSNHNSFYSEPKSKKYLTKANRYFARTPDIRKCYSESSATYFKPFLILNKVDAADPTGGKNVKDMLGVCEGNGLDVNTIKNEHTNPDGTWKVELGFEGYMNMLGNSNYVNTLGRAYKIAESILTRIGYFKANPSATVYDYFMDFRPEWLFTSWQNLYDAIKDGGRADISTDSYTEAAYVEDQQSMDEPTFDTSEQTQQTVEPTFSTGSQTQQSTIDMSEQFGDVDENLENVDIEFEGEDKAQSQALNNPFAQASNANNLTGQSLIDNATRDRLMNELLSQLSPATREKVFDDIAAAKNADLSKMNKLDKEELDNLREQSAYDTKQICVMGKDGKLEFKTEEIAPNSVRRLMAGKDETKCNYVAFSYPKVTNSIFMTNSPRKMAKQLNKIWQKFVYGLIRYKGGKLAIRSLDISDNNIIVNKQLIDTDNILAGGQLDSLADIADMVFLFDQLPGLVTVTMTTPIFELTNDQFDEILIKASKKRGTSLMSVEEYLFRTHEHLNTIIVDGRPITRAKILGMSQQDRESRFKQELNRRETSREARGLFSKLKNRTGTAKTDKRESRHQMRKSKYSAYRLGRFGYGMSKLLSKLLP